MSAPLYECVPNVADGRDLATIAACRDAITAAGAQLAHETSDREHDRSVFTFFGEAGEIVAAAANLALACVAHIDLRTQRGVHPRIGALDVFPVVSIDGDLDEAAAVARRAAAAMWEHACLPSLFYGAASITNRPLPAIRRGEFEGLPARAAAGEAADVGDVLYHPSAGTVAVGARPVLIAFNFEIAGADLAMVQQWARAIRERDGGLRSLRALGVEAGRHRVQLSCNITDCEAVPLYRLVALVRAMARRSGAVVTGTELIGLVPKHAIQSAVMHAFGDERAFETRVPGKESGS